MAGGFGRGGCALSWFSHGEEAALVPWALCEGFPSRAQWLVQPSPPGGTRPCALRVKEAPGKAGVLLGLLSHRDALCWEFFSLLSALV